MSVKLQLRSNVIFRLAQPTPFRGCLLESMGYCLLNRSRLELNCKQKARVEGCSTDSFLYFKVYSIKRVRSEKRGGLRFYHFCAPNPES